MRLTVLRLRPTPEGTAHYTQYQQQFRPDVWWRDRWGVLCPPGGVERVSTPGLGLPDDRRGGDTQAFGVRAARIGSLRPTAATVAGASTRVLGSEHDHGFAAGGKAAKEGTIEATPATMNCAEPIFLGGFPDRSRYAFALSLCLSTLPRGLGTRAGRAATPDSRGALTANSTYIVSFAGGTIPSNAATIVSVADGSIVARYTNVGEVLTKTSFPNFASAPRADSRIDALGAGRKPPLIERDRHRAGQDSARPDRIHSRIGSATMGSNHLCRFRLDHHTFPSADDWFLDFDEVIVEVRPHSALRDPKRVRGIRRHRATLPIAQTRKRTLGFYVPALIAVRSICEVSPIIVETFGNSHLTSRLVGILIKSEKLLASRTNVPVSS